MGDLKVGAHRRHHEPILGQDGKISRDQYRASPENTVSQLGAVLSGYSSTKKSEPITQYDPTVRLGKQNTIQYGEGSDSSFHNNRWLARPRYPRRVYPIRVYPHPTYSRPAHPRPVYPRPVYTHPTYPHPVYPHQTVRNNDNSPDRRHSDDESRGTRRVAEGSSK